MPGHVSRGGGRHAQVYQGRTDVASTELNDVRFLIETNLFNDEFRPWEDQRAFILDNLLYYPRGERVAAVHSSISYRKALRLALPHGFTG